VSQEIASARSTDCAIDPAMDMWTPTLTIFVSPGSFRAKSPCCRNVVSRNRKSLSSAEWKGEILTALQKWLSLFGMTTRRVRLATGLAYEDARGVFIGT
jgi:hypothetical protein